MEERMKEVKPPPMQLSENPPPPTPPPQKCPRCESFEVKFCYYNNYSTSQPRYFCKACRRYWTHGGTLRDIPVGGGSRRPKRAKTLSSVLSGNSAPQHAVAASNHSNGGFSSSSVAMNSSARPHASFQVGSSFSSFPVNRLPAQNLRQTDFYQRANLVFRFSNPTLENSSNNNRNNSRDNNGNINNNSRDNNGLNLTPSVGNSFNFMPNLPGYNMNNNNNRNNLSNQNPSVGNSFNFRPNFSGYGPPYS